jgi:putative Mg2+ transporter-C (MgtC) family protein
MATKNGGTSNECARFGRRFALLSSEVTEEELHYRIQITCRNEDENSLRLLMLQAVSSSSLVLRSLHSEDTGDASKVNVTADLDASTKSHILLEQIANRLSLERGVSAVSWALTGQQSAE